MSPATPFSIAPAPPAGDLQLCDGHTWAAIPIGVLFDGRTVVGESFFNLESGSWVFVRAWDPRTNVLEPLFVSPVRFPSGPGEQPPLSVSRDGKRIFEVKPSASPDDSVFRVYDVEAASFLSDQPLPLGISVTAISDDGRFVLDPQLRLYSAMGDLQLDFSQLLPGDVPIPALARPALSFDGGAVAAVVWDTADAFETVVVRANGQIVRLTDAPGVVGCDAGLCGFAWSPDGRYLLEYARGGSRVWELATAQVVARLDGNLLRARFSDDSAHFLTVDEQGTLVEHDLSGASTLTWSIDGRDAAFGPDGLVFGRDSAGLVVKGRRGIEGRWTEFGTAGWLGAVAVREDDSFTIVSDDSFQIRLDRVERGKGGAAATYRSSRSQSEWKGDVALAPDESRLAVVFPDMIAILDPVTLNPVARIDASAGRIAWSPDGRYLAATPDWHYRDHDRPSYTPAPEVVVWDATTGALAARFATPAYPTDIAFDRQGAKLAGWGYPAMQGLEGDLFSATQFQPSGDPVSFDIDVATGGVTTSARPPFLAATRELVATRDSVVALSTGQTVSQPASSPVRDGRFSGDFSVLLSLTDSETREWAAIRLVSVADGHELARLGGGYVASTQVPAFAISRSGRRVQVDSQIFCLTD